jgi:DNA-binding NarL/FixJ family response regulator
VAARHALLARPEVDVALCNVELPSVDGYRLLQDLRSLRPAIARRIVFYTRNPGTMAARAIARLHVRPLLLEPFTLGRVAAVFQEVLADDA